MLNGSAEKIWRVLCWLEQLQATAVANAANVANVPNVPNVVVTWPLSWSS